MARKSYDMKPRKLFTTFICALATSCSLIVIGILLICLRNIILHTIIDSSLILTPSSNVYNVWKSTPFKLPLNFYFFNWTNPNDIYNSSIKPNFKQMGPYKFNEMKHKVNVTWNDNGTVTFQQLRYWWALDENKLKEEITTINPVALTAAFVLKDASSIVKMGLGLFSSSEFSITHRAGEMLFDGYEDNMIDLGRSIPFLSKSMMPPWKKFGWFYSRNGSSDFDGVFNMGTGVGSIFGHLYNWNYLPNVKQYKGECGYLNGSAGELFPPYAKKTSISFYSPDICRLIKLKFIEEKMIDNILGYKYGTDFDFFDNGTRNPENKCFCLEEECIPSGAVNVSSCKFGSPAFVSLPHFLHADPYYRDNIEGMEPDKDKHDLYITLEPTTGIPLEVSARLQINLLLQPIEKMSPYENVPKLFIPIMWFEQSVKMPEDMIFNLGILMNLPLICIIFGVLSVLAGFVMILFSIYKVYTVNLCGHDKIIVQAEQVPLKGGKNKNNHFTPNKENPQNF